MMTPAMQLFATFLATAFLAAVHVFSNALRVLDGVPRSRFLSLAGGMAVAFVFLRLLPGLSEAQQAVAEAVSQSWAGNLNRHIYAVALASMILFYGAERLARASRGRSRERGGPDSTGPAVFWIHIATFAAMNVLVGYLVARHEKIRPLALFSVAMMLKFVVNDHGLHSDHKDAYDRIGRWMLAVAVLSGWGVGVLWRLPEFVPALLQSFLAGAVLLNVLKEEIPAGGSSRYWPFALGGVAYGGFLLAV